MGNGPCQGPGGLPTGRASRSVGMGTPRGLGFGLGCLGVLCIVGFKVAFANFPQERQYEVKEAFHVLVAATDLRGEMGRVDGDESLVVHFS